MKFLTTLSMIWLIALVISSSSVLSQTIAPGDYNLPEDGNFGDSQSIGSNTTINIFDGGSIGNDFSAGTSLSVNNTINLFGGSIGDDMTADSAGSEITIDGGSIGNRFSGRFVNLLEGAIGEDFDLASSGVLNMSGGTLGEDAILDGQVNMTGGIIRGNDFIFQAARVRGSLTVSGGLIEDIHVWSGGTITLNDGEIEWLESQSAGTAQVNGGRVSFVQAFNGSVLNIAGGYVRSMRARSGSVVNMSGGLLRYSMRAEIGSEVTIEGGVMDALYAPIGSDVSLVGNDFFLNGVSTAASSVTLGQGDILSGVLQDGSTFIFSEDISGVLQNVSLDRVSIGAASTDTIFVSDSNVPKGLRSGQHMVVQEGGLVNSNFSAIDSRFDLESGYVGFGLKASRSEVNISGGDVGVSAGRFGSLYSDASFTALLDSNVTISGGGISGFFDVHDSSVEVSGGRVNTGMRLYDGAEANISAGRLAGLTAFSGSQLEISGGHFGSQHKGLDVLSDASVRISGGALGEVDFAGGTALFQGNNFKLNGNDFADNSITLSPGDVFSGTLQDGSAFIFSATDNDRLVNADLERLSIPQANTSPIVIDATEVGPGSIRNGQTMTLAEGGSLTSLLNVVDANVFVDGGSADMEIEVLDSQFNMSTGQVSDLEMFGDSHAEITGGTLSRVEAFSGSVLELIGGDVSDFMLANEGSFVDVSTSITGNFSALDGSQLNLNGLEFYINGVAIDGLTIGDPFVISSRGSTLSGTMLDGSQFSTRLQSSVGSGPSDESSFLNGAVLTVTLLTGVALGDVDQNGDVDFFDIPPFIDLLINSAYQVEADTNEDGAVDFSDISSFIALLQNQ